MVKTMEVLNTDAEGRLILADALSYASEKNPQVIFDAATLTGAILHSLGNIFSGFFTKNEQLAKKIKQASENTGERVWQLPLTEEHTADIKSVLLMWPISLPIEGQEAPQLLLFWNTLWTKRSLGLTLILLEQLGM